MAVVIQDVAYAYENYREKINRPVFSSTLDNDTKIRMQKIANLCNQFHISPEKYFEIYAKLGFKHYLTHIAAESKLNYIKKELTRMENDKPNAIGLLKKQVEALMESWGISREEAIIEVKKMLGFKHNDQ